MVKAVIFDMDGVLIDSEPVYLYWERKFFSEYGIDISNDMYSDMIGFSDKEVIRIYKEVWKEKNIEGNFEKLYNAFYEEDKEVVNFNYLSILNPNVENVLMYLKSNDCKIALASSSPMADIKQMLEDCKLEKYFDAVVSGEEFEESKPNPEIYQYTAEMIGVEPNVCVVIEDSVSGIAAAKNAGMFVIAKREEKFYIDQSSADVIVDDLLEVINIISDI